MVSLMVGTAVQRLSNCIKNDTLVDASSGDNNSTSHETTCENDPVDIAVTLALLVGVFMVST